MKVGDIIVAAEKKGKIKSLINSSGEMVKEAGPSTPVEVLGLEDCVPAGEVFNVMKTEKDARNIIDERNAFDDLVKIEDSNRTKQIRK